MRALSLTQPWASLIAVGAKTIETRSWSTPHRGPLAIHASKKPAPLDAATGRLYHEAQGHVCRCGHDEGLHACVALTRTQCICGCTMFSPAELPLGAVVATAYLSHVLPILGPNNGYKSAGWWVGVDLAGDDLSIIRTDGIVRIDDQRPYGDFTPGRYAWLLRNITPLDEPIPARGQLGLWEWER